MKITLKELKKIVKQTINESFYKNEVGYYLVLDYGSGETISDTRYETKEEAQAAAKEEQWAQGVKIVNITEIINIK